jgi:hypothetical protein
VQHLGTIQFGGRGDDQVRDRAPVTVAAMLGKQALDLQRPVQWPDDAGLERTAGGLPGRYQVGWGKGGVYVRGGCSGAGDSDERDRVGSDPVPVALEG